MKTTLSRQRRPARSTAGHAPEGLACPRQARRGFLEAAVDCCNSATVARMPVGL
jgi:hypothetical protein